MKDLGNILYQRRQELGFSTEEVSKILKIRTIYLESIEKSYETARKTLPPVYLNGYVKSYSKFLGVGPDTILLEELCTNSPANLKDSPKNSIATIKPNFLVILLSFLIVTLVYLFWLESSKVTANKIYDTNSIDHVHQVNQHILNQRHSEPENDHFLRKDLTNKIKTILKSP